MPHLMASRCSADDMDLVCTVPVRAYNFSLIAQHFSSFFFVYRCKCCCGARSRKSELKIKGKREEGQEMKEGNNAGYSRVGFQHCFQTLLGKHYQLLASVSPPSQQAEQR